MLPTFKEITERERLEARMKAPLRGGNRAPDGLFADAHREREFEAVTEHKAAIWNRRVKGEKG